MEHTPINMAECDSNDNNSDYVLVVQETQDVFQESQDFCQESQDFFVDDFQFPPTTTDDPLQQETNKKISLTCEDYIKYDSSVDSDPTLDLEFTTFRKCDKDNKKDESNESVNMSEETSQDCDHSLSQDFELGCNVSTCHMDMVDGDSSDDNTSDSLLPIPHDLPEESQDLEIACNVLFCTFPHIFTYYQSQQDGNDPPLTEFMKMSIEIIGKDIIQEIAYHRHKTRFPKKSPKNIQTSVPDLTHY